MGILELKNINLELGKKQILKNLNIDIWEGHVHAIVGPNGAGKSTLASTIMGLSGYTHYSGDIIYQGENINDLPLNERANKGITLAWQEPARFEGLKVSDFILCSMKEKDMSLAEDALHKVGLNPPDYLNRAVDSSLSGGERKRIELASIYAIQPKIVILDEPDSGIDVAALDHIFELVKIFKEKGITIIAITHSLAVLQQVDHAFLMCNGEIIDKGGIDKIRQYFEGKCLPCQHKNVPDDEEEAIINE